MSTYDKDIHPILVQASSEELEALVGYLKTKYSESLTSHHKYKTYNPEHSKYSDVIADEICLMGGNSFANIFRGKGPSYHEIVCDVATKLSINYQKGYRVELIEDKIIIKVFQDVLDKMSPEERREVQNELGVPDLTTQTLSLVAGPIATILAQQLATTILGQATIFLARQGALGAVSTFSALIGPIGWLFSGVWAAYDIAGPAFSVTIPSVIHIAMLRKQFAEKKENDSEQYSSLHPNNVSKQKDLIKEQNTLITCSRCQNTMTSQNEKFCSNCGEAFIKCTYCGTPSTREGARFCTECGQEIENIEERAK